MRPQTYFSLAERRQREWERNLTVREQRHVLLMEAYKRPWTCNTCGIHHEQGGVCPDCRGARIFEWNGTEFIG